MGFRGAGALAWSKGTDPSVQPWWQAPLPRCCVHMWLPRPGLTPQPLLSPIEYAQAQPPPQSSSQV